MKASLFRSEPASTSPHPNRRLYKIYMAIPSEKLCESPEWGKYVLKGVERDRDEHNELRGTMSKGGMGEVYRGTLEGKVVAIKRCNPHTSSEGEGLFPSVGDLNRLAKREAFTLFSVKHPSIIECLGISYTVPGLQDEQCIIFPWYAQGTLFEAAKMPESQVHLPRWIVEVAEGMKYLHDLPDPILHGDLKASNILIDDNNCIRITDFGLSRRADTNSTMTPTAGTSTGAWMAPELYYSAPKKRFISFVRRRIILTNDNFHKSKETDVWAYGCTVFEIYEGKHPWNHLSTGNHYALTPAIQRAIKKGQKPGKQPKTMPDDVWMLVQRCWNFEPRKRPTMSYIKKHLSTILSPQETESSVPSA